MSRRGAATGTAWVGVALGVLVWIVTYVIGVVAYGVLLVVVVDPLIAASSSARNVVFALLVGLVLVAATLVAGVVVRRGRTGPAWWLLALPVLAAGWGVMSPPSDGPTWPTLLTALVGVLGSAGIVWTVGGRATGSSARGYAAR